MILASVLFSGIQVGHKLEACFQNFAAGLIIAAGIQDHHGLEQHKK